MGAEDLSRAVPREVLVHFADDQVARLTPEVPHSDVYVDILEQRRERGDPVYVEVEPEDRTIRRLRLPLIVTVAELETTKSGVVEVELEVSHARHLLKPAHPDFRRLLEDLRKARDERAPVLVTERLVDHEILDVRPSPVPRPWEERPESAEDRVMNLRAVTPERAHQLFELLAATSCHPLLLQPPSCIPFLYPDNGCSERADAMCQLLLHEGEQPGKLFVYDKLRPLSRNHPLCEVSWGFHVAPFLEVQLADGLQHWILDPSLFPRPVPESTWISALRATNPDPTTLHRPVSVFSRSIRRDVIFRPAGPGDPLAPHREALRLRSDRHGTPPYARCSV